MNLTDLSVTPLHVAFDEVCRRAEARGLRVTGSELVGLVPLRRCSRPDGTYLRRQQRSAGVFERGADPDRSEVAGTGGAGSVQARGTNHRVPAAPARRGSTRRAESGEHSSMRPRARAPAPGGGSVAAAVGALGAALGAMVANLSAHKRGWDDRWEEFSTWAEKGQALKDELVRLVDEDTRAFNQSDERACPSPRHARGDRWCVRPHSSGRTWRRSRCRSR